LDLTEEVAGFVVTTRPEAVGPAVRAIALDHIADHFGVALAGSRERSTAIVRSLAPAADARLGSAHAVGTGETLATAAAALVNGVAAHALDYDDTQLSTSTEGVYGLLTHPSTPVMSAATAVAEETGASGEALLVAYTIGVEVACRLADAAHPRHYQDGFHSTGTIGAFGATAAAARLYGLDVERTRMALGIAASLAAGVRENFGTMTKPLNAGRAAENGVVAARLARAGFTASQVALEARRGYLHAAAGGYEPGRIHDRLGRPWFLESPGVSIKPYPSGSLSHPAQDVAIALVVDNDVRPEDVERIVVGTNSNVPNALIHTRPRTGLEAKFSMQFCMAMAVLRRRAGLREFTDEEVQKPDVQALLPRCELVVDPELEALGYQHVRSRVRIELKDGRVLTGEAEWAHGYPTLPLDRAALFAKFRDCAEGTLDAERARRAFDAVYTLASAARAAEALAPLWSAAPPATA
jgi:2-methylcitrate dehydratase PrpD